MRFRPKRNATTRPRIVCRPRIGEKPKKTPSGVGQRGPMRRIVRVKQLFEPAREPGGKHAVQKCEKPAGRRSGRAVADEDHLGPASARRCG